MKKYLILIILFILIAGCSKGGKGIKLPDYEKMKTDAKELSREDIDELRELFLNLEPAVYEFFEKPEFLLYGYSHKNSKTPDVYSIFLAEGYIYVGDYFVAWADRMKGRTSKCYKLDEYTSYILENL
ncbi:hypothetical protein ACFLYK_02770 [Candidatus Cloacimonadota bacterium]